MNKKMLKTLKFVKSLLAINGLFVTTCPIIYGMEEIGYTNLRHGEFESLKYRVEKHKINPNSQHLEPLSYKDFTALKSTGAIPALDAERVIDHAYTVGNPILYRKAEVPVSPDEYSLNLLWIHQNKQTLGVTDHLFGKDIENFNQKIYKPIFNWQSKQPKAHINFWYDSKMLLSTSNSYIENTRRILKENHINVENVTFCDIRTLDVFEEHYYAQYLFMENTPVYFRVDLLKSIIADYEVRKKGLKYAVVSDLDISAITVHQLFDDLTVHQLPHYGYMFGCDAFHNQENNFMILTKGPILNQHRTEVINKGINHFYDSYIKEEESKIDPQAIFFDMLAPFKAKREEEVRNTPYKYGKVKPGKPMIFVSTHFDGNNGYEPDVVKVLNEALDNGEIQKSTVPLQGLTSKDSIAGITKFLSFLSGNTVEQNKVSKQMGMLNSDDQEMKIAVNTDLATALYFKPRQEADITCYQFGDKKIVSMSVRHISKNLKGTLKGRLKFLETSFPGVIIGETDCSHMKTNTDPAAPLKLYVQIGSEDLYFVLGAF